MTTISIQSEATDANALRFRAITGKRESYGRTPGEALDALNAEVNTTERSSLIIIQQIGTDAYFSEVQYLRMQDLLGRRESLVDEERNELERLTREELIASAKRMEALANAFGK